MALEIYLRQYSVNSNSNPFKVDVIWQSPFTFHQRKIIIITLETKLASVHSSFSKCNKCIFLKKERTLRHMCQWLKQVLTRASFIWLTSLTFCIKVTNKMFWHENILKHFWRQMFPGRNEVQFWFVFKLNRYLVAMMRNLLMPVHDLQCEERTLFLYWNVSL